MIEGILFEGKIVDIYTPCELNHVQCSRCGAYNMKKTIHQGKKVCFCMERECLRIDSEATKKIWKKKYNERLKSLQQQY
jgi:hypothetical protein